MGIDWVTHIDQDEIIYPATGRIAGALAACPEPVVRFEIMEAVDTGLPLASRFHADTFKKNISPEVMLSLSEDPQLASLFFQGEFFRGHTQSKCAFRVADFNGEIGAHGAKGGKDQTGQTSAIKLLHYDAVGEKEWKAKWSMRKGSVVGYGMRDNRKAQHALFAVTEGNPSAESAAYKLLHRPTAASISEGKQIGIIEVVSIDRSLFDVAR
jgi:hypothetical protein